MAVIMRSAAILTGAAFPEPGIVQMWWSPGTVGGSTADATDILARFRTCWEGAKALIDDAVTIDYDPICLAVEATTGVLTGAFAGTDPSTTVCTGTGDALPRQTQGLVRLGTSTVINGRRLRGRIFLPGPLEANNSADGTTTGYGTTITTAFSSIFTPGATASQAVIWHRPTGGGGGAAAAITSVGTAATWAVLRSRR